MADQAKERPQQPGQTAGRQAATAGSAPSATEGGGASTLPEALRRQQVAQRHASGIGSSPRMIQEAVPLSPVESDPLAEAARHFRELQAKSAGVTEMHMPARAAQTGDVARDLLKDDGQISSLALSAAASWRKPDAALPADMLADGDGAAGRATPRSRPRAVKKPETFIDVEAKPLDPQPASPTLVDMDPDLSWPLAASAATAPPSPVAETGAGGDRSQSAAAGDKLDEMDRALALAAQAPVMVAQPPAAPTEPSSTDAAPTEPSSSGAATPDTTPAKLPPFPVIDRGRRLPSGPSGNLRLFAGLSIVIAAFAGSLVWVAMWRADTFSGGAEATIDISPEDMVQTSAGSNSDGTVGSADSGGTATATLLVRDTELLLAKLAFDPGPTDGVLDDTTREAIRRYQEAAGLPQTGEPSKELLEELQAVVAAIDGN
jgi:hypothetical protein